MKYILPALFLTGILFSNQIYASNPSNLEALVTKIASNNGRYATEQASNAAQIQSMRTENNLSDPEVEFSHVWGQKAIGNKYDIGISQSFEWPGVYSARDKAVQFTSAALDYLSLQNLCELRLKIKQTMIDAINARKKIELYGEALATIDSLTKIVERNVQKKEVSILDANRLKIERIVFVNKYDEATMSYSDACNTLVELNSGAKCDEVLAMLTDFPEQSILRPLEAYKEENNKFNPQYSYQSSMKDAYLAQAKAIKRSALPGFSLGYTHEYEMGERFNGFSVSMTLPFLSSKGKRKAKEMEAEAFKMESEQNDISTDSRIYGDFSKAKLLSRQIGDYADIFNKQDHIKLLNKAFEARQITITDYLSDLIYFTQAKSDYYDLEYQYHLQLASLDRYSWFTNR